MRVLIISLLLAGCALEPHGQCSADAECTGGTRCSGGVCAGCVSSAECNSWEGCGSTHVCLATAGRCNQSVDCQTWESCDDPSHTCVVQASRCNLPSDCSAFQTCGDGHACALQAGRCNVTDDCDLLSQVCDASNICTSGEGTPLVAGSFGYGLCPVSLARADRLLSPAVGFESCDMSAFWIHTDGSIRYAHDNQLRTFAPDAWTLQHVTFGADEAVYPVAPLDDDQILYQASTAGCDLTRGDSMAWAIQGGGAPGVLFGCVVPGTTQITGELIRNWFDQDGVKQFTLQGNIVGWNADGMMLLSKSGGLAFSVVDAAGNETPLSGPAAGRIGVFSNAVRARPGGFWVVVPGLDNESFFSMAAVDNAGVATLVGPLDEGPANLGAIRIVIDPAGAIYTVSLDNSTLISYVIKHPLLPGKATVIASSKITVPDNFHIVPPIWTAYPWDLVTSP